MTGQLATKKDYVQWSGCQTVSRNANIPKERLLGGKKKLWLQKVGDLMPALSPLSPKSTNNQVVPEHRKKPQMVLWPLRF